MCHGAALQVILQPHLYHGAFLLDSASKHCLIAELAALLRARGRCLVAHLAAAPVLDRTLSAARHLLSEAADLQRDSSWELVDPPTELQLEETTSTRQPHLAQDQGRAPGRQRQAAAKTRESGLLAAAIGPAAAGVGEQASDSDVAPAQAALESRWGMCSKNGDRTGSTVAVCVARESREPLPLRSIAAAAAAAAAPLL
jgi:hypothetical protein